MFKYEPYIKSLLSFMVDNGYTSKPYPKILLNADEQDGVFINTGNYDPDRHIVRLYINGRHPKDVLRSLAHEMIHHQQEVEGRLKNGAYSGDRIVDDDKLIKLEEEAYLNGNISFREWTETVKK